MTRLQDWRDRNRHRYNGWARAYRVVSWQQIEKMLDDPAEYLFEREYRKRQALIKACPSWVDREAIRRIYAESVRLSRQLGVGMKVIHVIPIRDRKASGLHIPENLKVVSQSYADLYRCNLDQENLHYQSSLSALTNVHRS